MRDKVSRVRARLPDAIDEPVIAKVEADAFADHLDRRSRSDRSTRWRSPTIVKRIVKPRLQTVPGAADVRIFGERR